MQEAIDIITRLEQTVPIDEFKFGHTPLQIEYFQTTNQQGNEKWEYWQHVLQLRSLHTTLCELNVSYDEVSYEIEEVLSFWPFWTRKKRQQRYPRLRLKLKTLERSIAEKTNEANRHLEVISRKYSHLENITEDEILKEETSYWALRLGRQLGASHLSRVLGVSEGELLAVLSLPQEQQRQIFDGMKQVLSAVPASLPQKVGQ